MKSLLLISMLILSIPAQAADLYKSPQDAVNAFINPLKQGSKGLDQAVSSSKGINGEPAKEIESELRTQMKTSGKLMSAKMIDSDSRLNGNMQKFVYELKFANGAKREVKFVILQPQQDGGYMIMGMDME